MIEAALEAVEEREKRQARLHTDPIALLGRAFSQSKGVREAETRWFSPLEAEERRRYSQRVLDKGTAQLFLELVKLGKVPGWVSEFVDFDLIREAAL